jgi:epidermal growth factor receptor substrate 15
VHVLFAAYISYRRSQAGAGSSNTVDSSSVAAMRLRIGGICALVHACPALAATAIMAAESTAVISNSNSNSNSNSAASPSAESSRMAARSVLKALQLNDSIHRSSASSSSSKANKATHNSVSNDSVSSVQPQVTAVNSCDFAVSATTTAAGATITCVQQLLDTAVLQLVTAQARMAVAGHSARKLSKATATNDDTALQQQQQQSSVTSRSTNSRLNSSSSSNSTRGTNSGTTVADEHKQGGMLHEQTACLSLVLISALVSCSDEAKVRY